MPLNEKDKAVPINPWLPLVRVANQGSLSLILGVVLTTSTDLPLPSSVLVLPRPTSDEKIGGEEIGLQLMELNGEQLKRYEKQIPWLAGRDLKR